MLDKFKKGGFVIYETVDNWREVRRLCFVREVFLEEQILSLVFLDTEECVDFTHEWDKLFPCESEEDAHSFFREEFERLRSALRRIGTSATRERLDSKMSQRGAIEAIRSEHARIADRERTLRRQYDRYVQLKQ